MSNMPSVYESEKTNGLGETAPAGLHMPTIRSKPASRFSSSRRFSLQPQEPCSDRKAPPRSSVSFASLGDRAYASGETDFLGDLGLGHTAPVTRSRSRRVQEAMQDFLESEGRVIERERPASPCTKCDGLRKIMQEEKKKYLLETEHLRRGLEKLVEACTPVMSASQMANLMHQLQLDVRYLTKSAEEEGEGSPKHNRGPAVFGGGGGESQIDKLNRKINMLMEENEKLLAQLGEVSSGGGGAGANGKGGRGGAKLKTGTDREMQTDPMEFGGSKNNSSVDRDGGGKAGKKKKARKADGGGGGTRKAGGGGGADSDSSSEESSEDPVTGQRRPRPKKTHDSGGGRAPKATAGHPGHAGGGGGDGGGGGPPVNHEKLAALERQLAQITAEKDLLEMKLKSAEKGKVSLEDRLKALEKQMRDRDGEVSRLEQRIKDGENLVSILEGQLANAGAAPAGTASPTKGGAATGQAATKSGVKKAPKGGPDIPVAGKKGITKRNPNGSAAGGGGEGGTGGGGDGAEGEGAAENGEDAAEDAAEDEDEEGSEGPKMVDACVGNGPGPGLADDPIRCRGHKAPGVPRELNKNNRVYEHRLREFEKLSSMGETLCASTSMPSMDITTKPGASQLSTTAKGASRSLGEGSMSRELPSAATMQMSAAGVAAEPYLMRLLEKRSKGQTAPAPYDLQLGNLSPPASRSGKAAVTSDLGLMMTNSSVRA